MSLCLASTGLLVASASSRLFPESWYLLTTHSLADVGVEGTVAIEECDECPAPLTYIDDSVVCQYCNTQVYL